MDDGESNCKEEDGAEEEAGDVGVQIQDEGRDPEAEMGDADPEEDRRGESRDDMCVAPSPHMFFRLSLV